MTLRIETFSSRSGGNGLFKAVTHPLAARAAAPLLDRLAEGPVAIYDPDVQADAFAELYDLKQLDLAGVFVQGVEAIGRNLLGRPGRVVFELSDSHTKRAR